MNHMNQATEKRDKMPKKLLLSVFTLDGFNTVKEK